MGGGELVTELGAETSTTILARMIAGATVARMISVAAELGIADLLEDGPRACDDLAAATVTDPPSLYRLLRALASVGIFAEDSDRRFGLTLLADPLRSGAAGSLRGLARFQNDEWYWQVYRDLPYSVRTGKPATEHLWGDGLYGYFAAHPDAAELFNSGMASLHAETDTTVAAAYDFSGIQTLVDVGGGTGSLLATILTAHPHMNGILFDLPHVVEGAASVLSQANVEQRCHVVGGDFFERLPAGGDAYVLSNVLHNWQDERATAILRSVHHAMGGHGRLLVVNEHVIPPGNLPNAGKMADITMLLIGGRERTEAEWRHLFGQASFALTRIVPLPTRTGAGVLEGEPV
jgi:hypothetical protein